MKHNKELNDFYYKLIDILDILRKEASSDINSLERGKVLWCIQMGVDFEIVLNRLLHP